MYYLPDGRMNVAGPFWQTQEFEDLLLHLSLVVAGQRVMDDGLVQAIVAVDPRQPSLRPSIQTDRCVEDHKKTYDDE